jgi:enoyl-[acyl-carrier protein] reductase I
MHNPVQEKTMPNHKLLEGKKGLIMGVANDKSIAWGIAQAASHYGAELGFTYQNEVLLKRLELLVAQVNSDFMLECDVSQEASLDKIFEEVEKKWGALDFVVHAIGFSDKNELRGRYADTSLNNFLNTMNVSCYSFTAIAKRAEKLMPNGGSLLTLTYYGAEKAVPNYNVMGVAKAALESSVKYLALDLGGKGVRVNAISAGPIRTLAASGISDFRTMQRLSEVSSPLKRGTTLEDVAGSAIYLLSDLSSGTTGEVIHVDCGFHAIAMAANTEGSS